MTAEVNVAQTVVLNLQRARADRALQAPTIIAPDGTSYIIGGLTLDTYLQIIELEDALGAVTAGDPGESEIKSQAGLLVAFKGLVERAIPGFPVGDLELHEIMQVVRAIQVQGAPTPGEGGSEEAEPGE
jgi:hypothetical protein